jgi:hypothetical protein
VESSLERIGTELDAWYLANIAAGKKPVVRCILFAILCPSSPRRSPGAEAEIQRLCPAASSADAADFKRNGADEPFRIGPTKVGCAAIRKMLKPVDDRPTKAVRQEHFVPNSAD